MAPWWERPVGSPGALHAEGKEARDAIDAARQSVLRLLGGSDQDAELVFTGVGTEAVNLAVRGYAIATGALGKHVVCSVVEHPAVLNSVQSLEAAGFECERVPVDAQGRVDPDAIMAAVNERTTLVCCHVARAELGSLQALEVIGERVGKTGAAFFVDASDALWNADGDVDRIQADMVAVSPRRFGGPPGVGCLFKRRRIALEPLCLGGAQEGGLRAGMENVPGIVGAGAAAECERERRLSSHSSTLGALQRRLWTGLEARIPEIELIGAPLGEGRLVSQLTLRLRGVEAEGLVLFASLRGLALATGGGCLSRERDPYYVLNALGMDGVAVKETISLGLSDTTTSDEVEAAIEILAAGAERLRSLSPGWSS